MKALRPALQVAVVAALTTAVIPVALVAQSMRPGLDEGIRWVATDAVEPLTIAGTIVDAYLGQPLPNVQVYLAGTPVGALTNADGLFSLRAPSEGAFELRVEIIGFASGVDTVRVGERQGVAAYAGLGRQHMDFCDVVCVEGRCPEGAYIRLEVRDAVTGAPLGEEAVVSARGGAVLASSMLGAGDARAGIQFPDSVRSPGPYEVGVSAPGYQPWRVEDVWLEHGCPRLRSPILYAWLLPTSLP